MWWGSKSGQGRDISWLRDCCGALLDEPSHAPRCAPRHAPPAAFFVSPLTVVIIKHDSYSVQGLETLGDGELLWDEEAREVQHGKPQGIEL